MSTVDDSETKSPDIVLKAVSSAISALSITSIAPEISSIFPVAVLTVDDSETKSPDIVSACPER